MTAIPNLFIIGAMKSGTTYLHELLAGHPDILMTSPKEPCHFVDPVALARGWPRMARGGYCGNRPAYLDLFATGAGRRWRGESSTLYTWAPILTGVPARVHAMSPDARLIYLMRDPVDRSIAHFWHDARVTGAWQDLLAAMTPDSPYLIVSDYRRQLLPWYERFGREQVLAITFETLISRPAETLAQVLSWLGLTVDYVPSDLTVPRNMAGAVISVGGPHAALLYSFQQSEIGERIAALLPWGIRQLLWRPRPVARTDLDLAPVHTHLRRLQRPQTLALSELLGREFPEWIRLNQD